MSQEAYIRASLAMIATQTFPDTIRQALLSDIAFRAEYGVTVDAVFSFGASGCTFQRSKLMDAVRRAFRVRKKPPVVLDESGQSWTVSFDKSQYPQRILLASGQQRFVVVPLSLLSPSKMVRSSVFRHEADRVGLPDFNRKKNGKPSSPSVHRSMMS
jgi:hypothetical protein